MVHNEPLYGFDIYSGARIDPCGFSIFHPEILHCIKMEDHVDDDLGKKLQLARENMVNIALENCLIEL